MPALPDHTVIPTSIVKGNLIEWFGYIKVIQDDSTVCFHIALPNELRDTTARVELTYSVAYNSHVSIQNLNVDSLPYIEEIFQRDGTMSPNFSVAEKRNILVAPIETSSLIKLSRLDSFNLVGDKCLDFVYSENGISALSAADDVLWLLVQGILYIPGLNEGFTYKSIPVTEQ